jgi:retinol dehydrogenase 12
MQNFPLLASPEKGAQTPVYLASSPDVAGVTGRFYYRCREMRTKPITHDVKLARRLLDVSEALCRSSETHPSSAKAGA